MRDVVSCEYGTSYIKASKYKLILFENTSAKRAFTSMF